MKEKEFIKPVLHIVMTEEEIEEAKKKYLESGGSKCPFCNHEWMEEEKDIPVAAETYIRIKCLKCNREWTDKYRLVDVEFD